MKAIKKLLDTTVKKVIAITLLAIIVIWLILFFVATDIAIGLVQPILWTLLIVTVSWLVIHYGVKAWRKRKRSEFDEAVAAKEGIEDRRREWSTWTEELEKQGIDRYELPFYLLVGEPQSGKSVLLHNSDLHFPFGQNRLSGVGGTRGCDWWFTEEAVILDLAGRLFTHEGGAVDRLEFEAFLQLLYEFRPFCPANGVILVIPCNSLLQDSEEECAAKATKIQNALLTLTTKLQAQLPVYLVLTKGDQIFGFAESVHRLDVERRHQMFGWSRPAEKIDTPFDVTEVTQGFEEMVRRARLLRAHMGAGARLPEALPEVDRMYAFPHELAGMQSNLEIYLKRIFTASNITDRVFFRGLYLTSGLQAGVPIAKVCTQLFGQAGEADMRSLEALFSKQRAYFIKDLIRNRVFGERGLVRPTQGRVQQTRRVSVLGYGLSGLVVFLSLIFATVYLVSGTTDERTRIYDDAIQGTDKLAEDSKASIQDLLWRLQQIKDAVDLDPHAYEKAFVDPRGDFRKLYRELFDTRMVPLVKRLALEQIDAKLADGGSSIRSYQELQNVCQALATLLDDVDFSKKSVRDSVLGCMTDYGSGRTTVPGGQSLTLSVAFDTREGYGEPDGLLLPREPGDVSALVGLCNRGIKAVEGCLAPGAVTQPGNELGFMLAWYGAEQARKQLINSSRIVQEGRSIQLANQFSRSMKALERIEAEDLSAGTSGRTIKIADFLIQARRLIGVRDRMVTFITDHGTGPPPKANWPGMHDLLPWGSDKFQGHEGAINLSSFGLQFGSEDAGQTLFQMSESAISTATGELDIGASDNPNPKEDLDDPPGLRQICDQALPLDIRDGGLAGLATKFHFIGWTVLSRDGPGVPNFEVFIAESIQFTGLFQAQVQTPADAVRAVLGKDAEVVDGQLCVPLVDELANLHREISAFIKEKALVDIARDGMHRWQDHIENLLYAHLKACGHAEDWIPEITPEGDFSEEAWGVLQALSLASGLTLASPGKYPVKNVAEDVERDAFFALARQLEGRWEARPIGDLEETKKSVRELNTLADLVATRLSNSESLGVGGYLEAWGNRIDSILNARLGKLVENVERIWEPDVKRGSFQGSMQAAYKEINSIQEKIDESQREGMNALGPILTALKEDGKVTNWLGLPQVKAAAKRLAECRIPITASEVLNDPEYISLVGTMRGLLQENTGADGFGGYLAKKYSDEIADIGFDDAGGPKNAGIRLVRETKRKLGDIVLGEVKRLYLADLESLFDKSKYRVVLDVLFWDKDQEPLDTSDVEIRDNLDDLLSPKKGDFFGLMKDYRLAGVEKPIGALVFPAVPQRGEEGDWADFHRFLAGLQEFLFAGGAKGLRDASFSFTIRPQVGASGSLWSLGSIDAGERRDFFYYPGDKSTEDLKNEVIGPNMNTRLRVSEWGFGVSRPDRGFLMIWSKLPVPSAARTDPNRYYYEVRSCLAPLLLAWSGTCVDETERLEFEVDITPERSNRPAPLRLEFDNPLPLRPSRP